MQRLELQGKSSLVLVYVIVTHYMHHRSLPVTRNRGCVLGNFLTGVVTIILLLIGTVEPATAVTFGFFVAIMYLGFPMTVISQLSTGPMLDMIAPSARRGYVQGLNTSVMNFGSAIFPWVFGIIADQIGTETTIWICVGVSFLAALANSPLLFASQLKRKKYIPDYSRILKGEDTDFVQKALNGEWIPAEELSKINNERFETGHHFLRIPWTPYEEDRDRLKAIKMHAAEDFSFNQARIAGYVNSENLATPENRQELVEKIKVSRVTLEERKEIGKDMGAWFSDYLMDAGYHVDESAIMYKQMIMQAFPRLKESGDELTVDNIEESTLKWSRVLNHYLEEEEEAGYLQAFARSYAN